MSEPGIQVVLGASGGLGQAVTRELARQGARVRAVSRKGHPSPPSGVESIRADATEVNALSRACEGAETLFLCARPAYTDWPRSFPPLVRGALEAARRTGVKVVYGDNLYMYGPTSQPLKETLPNGNPGPKGRTTALLAEEILGAHRRGEVKAAIGRGSDFFGPGVLDSAAAVAFPPALRGKPAPALGNLDLPHTYTFIDDMARGLITLSKQPAAFGEVWHIPSCETVTSREFLERVFRLANHKPRYRIASRTLLRIFGLFSPMMKELHEMVYEFEEPFVLDTSKFERAFGKQVTPLDEALKQTVRWFQQRTA